MGRRKSIFLFWLIFLFVLVVTFPFHYLKDRLFAKVGQWTAGSVQLYSNDFGIGMKGLKFDDAIVSISGLLLEAESLSLRPSLDALFNGALGAALSIDGVYGSDIEADAGRSPGGFFLSVESNNINLRSLPNLLSGLPAIAQKIPNLEGTLDVDISMKTEGNTFVFPPRGGNGRISLRIPSLTVPGKIPLQVLELPGFKSVTPGLDASVTIDGTTIRTDRPITIGKKGQDLNAKIEGNVKLAQQILATQLDLTIEVSFGPEYRNREEIKNIITSSLVQKFVKGQDTLAIRLKGSVGSPIAEAL